MSDEILYTIEENVGIVDSYTIVKNKESDISMKEVIFLTCIIDAIEDAMEAGNEA